MLDEEKTCQCWKTTIRGQERLFLSPAAIIFDGDTVYLRSRKREDLWFACFPGMRAGTSVPASPKGLFSRHDFITPKKSIKLEITKIRQAAPAHPASIGSQGVATPPEESAFEEAETWQVRLPPQAFDEVHDLFLVVDYAGDIGRAYLGETLIADDFYNGRLWEIGLCRFLPEVLTEGLMLKFLPLHPDAPIYFPPEFKPVNGGDLVRSIQVQPEYEKKITL